MIFLRKRQTPRNSTFEPLPQIFLKQKIERECFAPFYEIRFKSLSVSLEIFTKFGQKFVHFCHFEPFFGQIEANVHYLQATSEKTD